MVGAGDVVAGRYRLERERFSGTWGRIFHGFDDRDAQVIVAVADSTSASGRFERDTRTAATLSHPVLASIVDHSVEGTPFVVYENVGTPLHEILGERGPLEARQALRLLVQILQALEHAHAAGLSHGILDAASVLISPGDRATLIGLGLRGDADPRDDVRAAGRLLDRMLGPERAPRLDEVVRGAQAGTGMYATPRGMRRAIEAIRVEIAPPDIEVEEAAGRDDNASTVWPIPEARYDPTSLGRRVIAAMIVIALIAGAAFLWRVVNRAEELREERADESPAPSVTTSAETLGLS